MPAGAKLTLQLKAQAPLQGTNQFGGFTQSENKGSNRCRALRVPFKKQRAMQGKKR